MYEDNIWKTQPRYSGEYKQRLSTGTLNLHISGGGGGAGAGKIVTYHLTDDSVTTSGSATITNLGRQFNLVSGSSGQMRGSTLAQTNAGSYGFVYTYNIANNCPNKDNAYTFLNAILASPEIGASMTKASGFISTYKDASNYLTDLEKQSTSFPDEQIANLQFFRAEANKMKYGLVDPAVEAVAAAAPQSQAQPDIRFRSVLPPTPVPSPNPTAT